MKQFPQLCSPKWWEAFRKIDAFPVAALAKAKENCKMKRGSPSLKEKTLLRVSEMKRKNTFDDNSHKQCR
ncbi:hypothetical protein VNO78_02761 [Psophocarpus tetragonolobus]|uniref:Uncharacterized protein n=1 Tax=Psophocarpus tetragonolobus TaxID=3891 RepID=A0AAN9T322_PSOTE